MVTLRSRFRDLIKPPLTGDGLLFVGMVAGLIGWIMTYLIRTQILAYNPLTSIIAVWVVLFTGVVVIGFVYTPPLVRRAQLWVLWGALVFGGLLINTAATFNIIEAEYLTYAYWHPWFAVYGIGYTASGVLGYMDRRITRLGVIVFIGSGLASLGALGYMIGFGARIPYLQFLGIVHVSPIAVAVYDRSIRVAKFLS